ncbi:hypothetical protein F5B17DRAFT_164390 [Nemania serpens]|nr:hypothetical protein F5B17DRAFT_164390 [Nemania serpens]
MYTGCHLFNLFMRSPSQATPPPQLFSIWLVLPLTATILTATITTYNPVGRLPLLQRSGFGNWWWRQDSLSWVACICVRSGIPPSSSSSPIPCATCSGIPLECCF